MGEREVCVGGGGFCRGKWLKLIRHEKPLHTGAREARQNLVKKTGRKTAKQAVSLPISYVKVPGEGEGEQAASQSEGYYSVCVSAI